MQPTNPHRLRQAQPFSGDEKAWILARSREARDLYLRLVTAHMHAKPRSKRQKRLNALCIRAHRRALRRNLWI